MAKFKVGDRVRCNKKPGVFKGDSIYPGGAGFEPLLEFEIKEINKLGQVSDSSIQVLFPGKNGYGVYSDSVELVESIDKLEASSMITVDDECNGNKAEGIYSIMNVGCNEFKPVMSDQDCSFYKLVKDSIYERESQSKYMSIKSKIKMALTPEPTKTLIKAGVLDENQELTQEGRALFHDHLWEKFGAEFAAKIQPSLKDDKESK